jgi:hypothetical protein
MSEQLTANGLAEGLALLIESVRESNQGQRQRFLIMDSQLRLLNELAGRLENLEQRFENMLHDYKAHCKIYARLNILCTDVGLKDKGPQNDGEEEEINQKLTDWH